MISDQRIISIARLVDALRGQGVPAPSIRRVLVQALGLDEPSAALVVPDVTLPPTLDEPEAPRPPNPAAILEALEEALDADPTRTEAFDALTRILTEREDWKQLERAHRKMIARIHRDADPRTMGSRWYALGLIYRDRLGHEAAAIEALKMALKVQPDDADTIAALRALGA
jgi:cytochrome c-type biogenesis protein CcmH/NrfG